jgi:hypothetical protein
MIFSHFNFVVEKERKCFIYSLYCTFNLELYPDLVFWFGIGRYFLGIFPTDTEGKLGWDVLVLYIWQEPLFSLKERLLPPY